MAKKRANGEGSIRKKPSGRWEGRYTQGIDPVTGKAIQKSVSAKTQAECKEKLAKAIRENRGVPINHTGDYTVAEWCRLWFETYSKPNICATTENIVHYQQEGGFPDRVVACVGTQYHTKSRIENNSLLVELFTVNLMQHNRAPHVLHHI